MSGIKKFSELSKEELVKQMSLICCYRCDSVHIDSVDNHWSCQDCDCVCCDSCIEEGDFEEDNEFFCEECRKKYLVEEEKDSDDEELSYCDGDETCACEQCKWANDDLVLELNYDRCLVEHYAGLEESGRHPKTNDADWNLICEIFWKPYSEQIYRRLEARLKERKEAKNVDSQIVFEL